LHEREKTTCRRFTGGRSIKTLPSFPHIGLSPTADRSPSPNTGQIGRAENSLA
jgi:hypothetical protein